MRLRDVNSDQECQKDKLALLTPAQMGEADGAAEASGVDGFGPGRHDDIHVKCNKLVRKRRQQFHLVAGPAVIYRDVLADDVSVLAQAQ